jgi:hypothetical protein
MNLGYDQPATIIKNDNGMFTIRNPALHQALTAQNTNVYRPFNDPLLQPPPSHAPGQYPYLQPPPDNLKYLSEGTSSHLANEAVRKCNAAIGSEMKNQKKQMQQQQQQQQQKWQPPINGGAGTRSDIFTKMGRQCYSPFEMPYGLTNNFLEAATNTVGSYDPSPANPLNNGFGDLYYNNGGVSAKYFSDCTPSQRHRTAGDDYAPNFYESMSVSSGSGITPSQVNTQIVYLF